MVLFHGVNLDANIIHINMIKIHPLFRADGSAECSIVKTHSCDSLKGRKSLRGGEGVLAVSLLHCYSYILSYLYPALSYDGLVIFCTSNLVGNSGLHVFSVSYLVNSNQYITYAYILNIRSIRYEQSKIRTNQNYKPVNVVS